MNKLHTCFILLAIALLSLLYANILDKTKPIDFTKMEFTDFEAREMIVPLPTYPIFPSPTPTPKPNRATVYYHNILKKCYFDEVTLPVTELELTNLGKYFITAYCPSECGYNGHNYPRGWTTASSTICHRASYSERYTKPTTCAISRSIHNNL